MADEADWVFGEWNILDSDREAQRQGKPYWTLQEPVGYGSMVLTRGPLGRKAMEPESTIYATGYETDGLGCSEEDQSMLLALLNRK